MNALLYPLGVVDIVGSALTIALSLWAMGIMSNVHRKRPEVALYTFLYAQTMALVVLALSRSGGHIVKHILLITDHPEIWKALSPISGGINSLTFVVFGLTALFYSNVKDISERMDALKRARARMRESEEKYRSIYEGARDGIVLIDRETGMIAECNPEFENQSGRKLEELQGMKIWELRPPDKVEAARKKFEEIRESGGDGAADLPLQRPVGEVVPIEFSSKVVSIGGRDYIQSISRDITERKQAESVNMARLRLLQFAATHTLDELLQETLDEVEVLTGSLISFYHFVEKDQKTLALQNWSTRTKAEFCTAEGKGTHYPISEAGVWVDCVYERRPVIHNDYASLPNRKGLPPGHAPVIRELVVPVIRGDKIMAILGVGNKPVDYTEEDVKTVSLFASLAWEVAELKRMEEALKQSEEKFRNLVEVSSDWIWEVDGNFVFTYVSPNVSDILGYEPDELIGKTPFDFMPAEEASRISEISKSIAVSAEPFTNLENTNIQKDGHQITIETNGMSFFDAKGGLLGYRGVSRDITERKRAEDALQVSEKRYRELFEKSADAIFILDGNRFIDCNNSTLEMFRCKGKEELVKLHPSELSPEKQPDHRTSYEKAEEMMKIAYEKGSNRFEWLHKRVDGDIFPAEVSLTAVPYDERKLLHAIVRDITARKRAEEDIKKLNRALRTLSAGNEKLVRVKEEAVLLQEICNIIVDQGGYLLAWVGFAEEDEAKTVRPMAQAGFREGRLGTMKVSWADNKLGRGPTGTAIRTGKPSVCKDTLYDPDYAPWRDEADKLDYSSAIAIPLSSGAKTLGALSIYASEPNAFSEEEIKLLVELADDMAFGIMALRTHIERERAEEMVREREEKYRSLVESANDALFVADTETGIIVECNEAASRLLGMPRKEIIGMPQAGIHPKEEAERYKNMIKADIRKGRALETEALIVRRDGTKVPVEISSSVFVAGGKTFLQGIFRDVSERKESEVKIRRNLDRITTLRNIDMAITASLDLGVTLNIFLEQLISQLKVDAAAVMLLNPRTQLLEYAAGRGFKTSAISILAQRLGEGYTGQVALERKLVILTDLSDVDPGFSKLYALKSEEGFQAYVGIPLVAKGEVKGVLEIFQRTFFRPEQDWLDFLGALAGQAAIAIDSAMLFDGLQRSNTELRMAYDATIEGWSQALDYRDKETEGHSQRVMETTVKIAREMGMNEEELMHVRRGALLHDIGKLGIPDRILLKPGKLTDEEWEIMKSHSLIAHKLLSPIAFLRPAIDIPYRHHEKWDGTGYPHGLKGDEIPLSARIFSVVDVWDALRSDRPYRSAWSEEKTREYIQSLAGVEFDPNVVNVFSEMVDKGTL